MVLCYHCCPSPRLRMARRSSSAMGSIKLRLLKLLELDFNELREEGTRNVWASVAVQPDRFQGE